MADQGQLNYSIYSTLLPFVTRFAGSDNEKHLNYLLYNIFSIEILLFVYTPKDA